MNEDKNQNMGLVFETQQGSVQPLQLHLLQHCQQDQHGLATT